MPAICIMLAWCGQVATTSEETTAAGLGGATALLHQFVQQSSPATQENCKSTNRMWDYLPCRVVADNPGEITLGMGSLLSYSIVDFTMLHFELNDIHLRHTLLS